MKYVIGAFFAIMIAIVVIAANESTPKQQFIVQDNGVLVEVFMKDSVGNITLVDSYIKRK